MASNRDAYEIGVVYVKNSKYFLAISDVDLIHRHRGGWEEVRPYSKYKPDRELSVARLCERWRITIEQLDAMSCDYFMPHDCRDANPSHRKISSNFTRLIRSFKRGYRE